MKTLRKIHKHRICQRYSGLEFRKWKWTVGSHLGTIDPRAQLGPESFCSLTS